MKRLAVIGLLLASCSVMAQDSVGSSPAITLGEPSYTYDMAIGGNNSKIVATVTPEGEVTINWKATEEAAKQNCKATTTNSMFYTCSSMSKTLAQLMLAIRDKTYKEVKE